MGRKLLFGFAFLLVVFAAGFVSAQNFVSDYDQSSIKVNSNPEINLTVAPWYPKESDYVFICDAKEFTPTSYSWWFGDGEKLIDVKEKSVFHRYRNQGTYTVMCSATDGNVSAEGLLTIAVEDNVNNITILEEYSAEHNQIFRCNTRIENVTNYIWYVDGEQVFEKTPSSQYYHGDIFHPTFPNYFHTFPGNGSYEVSCFAENDLGESTKVFRTVDISTRATPEEIEGNIAVPRVNVEYLGDYIVKHTCEIIGIVSPVAQFSTYGSHNTSDSYMDFSVNGYGDSVGPAVYELNETLPSFGNHTLLCTGGTISQDEYSEWHNKGLRASQSCLGGPRDGYPKCNVGKASEDFSIEKEGHILSGIYVERLDNDTYEARCYPRRGGGYLHMEVPGSGRVMVFHEGDPLEFNTTLEEFTVDCDAGNHILSRGSRREAFFSQKFNFIPANASIKIHEIFPADQVYVFSCDTDNLEETNDTVWTWDFGDGTNITKKGFRTYRFNPYGPDAVPNKDVYHTFPKGGEFNVTCTANDGRKNASASKIVNVDYQPAAKIDVTPLGDLSYNFYCDPRGFDLTEDYSGTAWYIRNESRVILDYGPHGPKRLDLNFTFPREGNYTVRCTPKSADDRFLEVYWEEAHRYTPCTGTFGCILQEVSIKIEV